MSSDGPIGTEPDTRRHPRTAGNVSRLCALPRNPPSMARDTSCHASPIWTRMLLSQWAEGMNMRCHIALLVALLGWFASPVSAQIYAAQADPSAPSGYTVTTLTQSAPGTMYGGPASHGILGVCNANATAQTIRVWCGYLTVSEIGLLAGQCHVLPGPLWPACEVNMRVTMSEPPSGSEIDIGTLVTVDGF